MSENTKAYGSQPRALKVGHGTPWPANIASKATALLGIRGAGKSTLARVMAEECYRSKIPVVIFDPVGNWYGIRAGKDGKPDGGLPFVIFGGRHGDVPLEANAGQLVADTIVDTRLSCVLDMSHEDFSEGDKRRFLATFGDRLFRRKTEETGWMLLILEEVDDYAPQSPRGDQAVTLGVFQRLVKRGRFKGLGALLVTQRSAAVNKDLLYMVETLVAFRTTAPRDQETVADWMKHHALGKEALSTLHELGAGEAWVWSPEAMGILERQKFRRMETWDTGRTPEHVTGQAARPATLADIDVPALTQRMADVVERQKADDPRELRKRIAELQAELGQAQRLKAGTVLRKAVKVEVPILKDTQFKALEAFASRASAHLERWEQLQEKAHQAGAAALEAAALLQAQTQEIGRALAAWEGGADGHATRKIVPPRGTGPEVAGSGPVFDDAAFDAAADALGHEPAHHQAGGREDGPTRILTTIAELQVRQLPLTKEAVARWLGIHPNGRRYNGDLATLRAQGELDGLLPRATHRRRHVAGSTGVLAVLSGSTRTVMQTILGQGDTRGASGLSKEQLAEKLKIHPNGRRFNGDLAWLRQMGVIPERGAIYPVRGVFL